MRSQDSTQYYDHHAFRLSTQPVLRGEGIIKPFLDLLAPNSRVIDLGCGTGIDLVMIKARGHQVYGLDASKGMVEAAQNRGLDKVTQKNVLFWTPKVAEWNGIWANRSFQHFTAEEAQRVVASSFQGLAVGGILGLIVPEGVGTFEDREGDLSGPSRWIHCFTENQICSMLEQTGFKILQVGRRSTNEEGAVDNELLLLAKRI